MEKLDMVKLIIEIVLGVAAFSLSLNIKMVLSKLKEIEEELVDLKIKLVQLETDLRNLKQNLDQRGIWNK
jgi:hypothetical protein